MYRGVCNRSNAGIPRGKWQQAQL